MNKVQMTVMTVPCPKCGAPVRTFIADEHMLVFEDEDGDQILLHPFVCVQCALRTRQMNEWRAAVLFRGESSEGMPEPWQN